MFNRRFAGIVIGLVVLLLASGCQSQSNQELALNAGLTEEEFVQLDRGIKEDAGEATARNYRIKRITIPDNPGLIREVTSVTEVKDSTEIWCIEIDYGVGSYARDQEGYFARTENGIVVFGVLGGGPNGTREVWWERFGC
ncbi:MAG: hypothetical protein AAFV33_08980 [Chloroflexota bacterium]